MRCTVLSAAIASHVIGNMCLAASVAPADTAANTTPQCAPTPRDCAALALTAMGGRERIEAGESACCQPPCRSGHSGIHTLARHAELEA
jgi:hypothetical protein